MTRKGKTKPVGRKRGETAMALPRFVDQKRGPAPNKRKAQFSHRNKDVTRSWAGGGKGKKDVTTDNEEYGP